MSYRIRGPYAAFTDCIAWTVVITGAVAVVGSVLFTLITVVEVLR